MEIEAKLKIDAISQLAKKLECLGAVCEGRQTEVDRYLDDAGGSLTAGDKALRIRRRPDRVDAPAVITYKGPGGRGKFKRREEIEISVSDESSAARLLAGLGYRERITVEKLRETWLLDDCKVTLDEVKGLGDFMEIEGPDEDAVERMRCKLGLQKIAHISGSYASMLASRNLKDSRHVH